MSIIASSAVLAFIVAWIFIVYGDEQESDEQL